jgi:hypothetical protein
VRRPDHNLIIAVGAMLISLYVGLAIPKFIGGILTLFGILFIFCGILGHFDKE